ncbi:MAG: hypothetical protein P8124_04740 [Gammaproteobacteria bacterium]
MAETERNSIADTILEEQIIQALRTVYDPEMRTRAWRSMQTG